MKKLILPVVIAAAAVILASCSSAPKLYEWYTYTDTTYQYIKAGDDEATTKLFEVYQKVIDGQEKAVRQTVPPGVYADYGYLLVKAGKVKEGKEMLTKEMELYPESAAFINSILKRIK